MILLNKIISFHSCFVGSILFSILKMRGFLEIKTISLVSITPYILNSFSYLATLTSVYNAMLIRRNKSGYTCIIPDIRREVFIISQLSIMSVVHFPLQIAKVPFYT